MVHKTSLRQTYLTGAELWECSTCGRLVVWQRPPLKLKNIVLVEGDNAVYHCGETSIEGARLDMGAEVDENIVPIELKDQIDDVLKGLELE